MTRYEHEDDQGYREASKEKEGENMLKIVFDQLKIKVWNPQLSKVRRTKLVPLIGQVRITKFRVR